MATAHQKKHGVGFSTAFYQQVPPEDIAGWKSDDLHAVADSMHDFALTRSPGKQKLRVFTPSLQRDGWHAPHTVIQIINDDMPFIVDSIAAELAAQNLTVDVLFHPILKVKRDRAGKLEGMGSDGTCLVESYMFIRLEQVLSDALTTRLEKTLHNILDDVRSATSDWRNLIAKLDTVIDSQKENLNEAQDFLKYLKSNNFTFLGYRSFSFSGTNGKIQSRAVAGSDLGILRNNKTIGFGESNRSPEIQALKNCKSPVMVSKLIDQYSTVHRRVPMDAISVKIIDGDGQLTGFHLFVGLFTSSTYSCRTEEIPMVRQKVSDTIKRAGFPSGTHDRAALEHILEKMPRDELFEVSSDALYTTALGILRLQAKQRVALFTHMDPMQRYMSCLVYVPRDRYNTKFRQAAAAVLEKSLHGKSTNYFTTLDDSPLARVLFTIHLPPKSDISFDHAAAEQQLIDIGREWDERLKQVLIMAHGKKAGTELAYTYGKAFTSSYHESIDVKNAVHDVRHLEALLRGEEAIRLDLYRLNDAPAGEVRLKAYHKNTPVPLSDILPVLENMGLKCRSEMPYEVHPQGRDNPIWIHDFVLLGAPDVKISDVKENFEEMFLQVWHGRAENDALNQLVLLANLTWREVMILRTYNSFMRQEKFPFSRAYIEQALSLYPQIARELVQLFKEMHDPKLKTPAGSRGKAGSARILDMLQSVQKLDHDRILRSFKTLIEKTLRTSYFQTNEGGQPKSHLAIKLDSKNIADLPLPRPHVEIYVYSTRVEAIHLRGGEIARGGIRWSDRHDDFRTEVLGLMKSQMVKNAVIVPVGAKGGFIVKQPPKTGGREAYQQEGVECYKVFIQALLDLTDNNIDGRIIRPKGVVCHDGADPYLVVAADKGTATFSNIANELSLRANFWLQDAFASGGSTGYDHKAIAITARGGWESVKRHFREMGKDIQKENFTLIGVGDMAGDVFGNAMLLSKKILLMGAFNHVHIFCDPTPDAEEGFAERERLFKARGGWDAYDKEKLSAGGTIYERSAKFLKLTPQIKKCFGLQSDQVTPDDLIKAILKANVELIWFGGIGTFLKSSRQSHADADDKSNDAIRIDANEVRAKVIGEGANMGVTQLARIEYARMGGRINTDFIDNSGGVDCSDHEVNIKILLADVMAQGKMTLPQRNKLMTQMTDEVAALVLRDNYQQTQSLSLLLFKAKEQVGMHAEFIRDLEKSGLIKRQLEGLPDDETLARIIRDGGGLTRPELSILLAYAKMTLFTEIMKSKIPDDPAMDSLLFDYFPKVLHRFDAEIRNHKLKRGIIATQIVNILINRMGPVFVQSRTLKTGASAEEVIRAFVIVTDSLQISNTWGAIEALDNRVHSPAQMTALHEVSQVIKRAVTWFLRFGGGHLKVKEEISAFKPGIELLKKNIEKTLPDSTLQALQQNEKKLVERGMPKEIAEDIAVLNVLSSANDIITIARRTKGDIPVIAPAYFQIGEKLGLDWLRQQASHLSPENAWQARAISGLIDDFYIQQAALTSVILETTKKPATDKSTAGRSAIINEWFDQRGGTVGKIMQLINDLKQEQKIELEMLTLVSQRIGQMVYQVK
ncbi:MAG: NAD-glutamate dehydrogenase [Proteobacteria bacterium]|nr:NAD-glutamate dehydrogenase [Pseudomonadota bacterium]